MRMIGVFAWGIVGAVIGSFNPAACIPFAFGCFVFGVWEIVATILEKKS